jgi:antitoxin PrlF
MSIVALLMERVMSTTAVSKLTSKYQTTIPAPVRNAMDLSPGDLLTYEVGEGGGVILRKWAPIDFEWAQAVESTLSEWGTDEDAEAYDEL